MLGHADQHADRDGYLVYAGTYTDGDSQGIYLFGLDMPTGALRPMGLAAKANNPSFLAIDEQRSRLYSVNELMTFDGRPGGAVSAFAMDPASGGLSLISQRHSQGGAPCYLAPDANGRYLLVANYKGGNIVVFPIGGDGVLDKPSEVVTHSGSGQHPQPQTSAHPHSIVLDPAGNYVFVPDLGLDRVMQYRFDSNAGRLQPNQPAWTEAQAGSGPRHLVFHPNGLNAYVINELNSTITVFAYDASRGQLKPIQTAPTIPDGYSGPNTAADLHLTPDGRLLLGSNRGHDSIACYAIEAGSGRLSALDVVPTQGKTPRGFAIDPSGTYVLVANQDSHSIVTFRIDKEQGKLLPAGQAAEAPSPVCIRFWRPK